MGTKRRNHAHSIDRTGQRPVEEGGATVRLMAESGCVGVFVGLETFSEPNLSRVDKGLNRVSEYRERIRLLHHYGIGVEAGVVLGFDADSAGTLRETLKALDDLCIDMAQISVLTPLPGTPLFRTMGDRILDRNWAHYDFHHVVFQPSRMSVEALQAGHDWLTREFYRPWRVARRLWRLAVRPRSARVLPYAAAINAAYTGACPIGL